MLLYILMKKGGKHNIIFTCKKNNLELLFLTWINNIHNRYEMFIIDDKYL